MTAGTPHRRLQAGHALRRLLQGYWWQERRALGLAYTATLLSILCVAVAPWPLQAIIDSVIGHRPLPAWCPHGFADFSAAGQIALFAALAAFAATVGALTGALEKNLNAGVRERMTLKLRDEVIAHLQTLALALAPGARNGELALRVVDDVQQVVRLLTKSVPQIVRHLGVSVVLLVVMFGIDPRLCALGLCVLLALAAISRHYARRLRHAAHDKRHQEGAVAGLTQEIMRGLPNVQSPAAAAQLRESFARLNAQSLRAGVEESRIAVALERTMQIANGCALALVTGVGAMMVVRGLLSVGELTVFAAYMNQLFKPVDKINELASSLSRALARAARLQELLAQPPLVCDPESPVPLVTPRGLIELRGVGFAYPLDAAGHGGVRLFDGVDLAFEPGRLYVIVGASGSGKSTLFRLLTRVFDPDAGSLAFDGIPYLDLRLDDLRRQFAFVHQQTHLLAGSLREALQPPGLALTDEELRAALAEVRLDDFLASLSQGLDTPLSEDGLNLSGGQRTRLAIARAMLTPCPVVLFDEPLANVDAASQAVIVAAIARIARHRTCIAISHQPALIAAADHLLSLDEHHLQPVAAPPAVHILRSNT